MSADKQVSYEVSADSAQFVQAMQRCAAVTQSAASDIKRQMDSVGDAFGKVQKVLGTLAAVVAGGAFFKDAIQATNKLTSETTSLSRRLGITVDEASALNTALGDIYSDSDTYIGAFEKFAKQLKNNEQGLRDMGLKTRESNGELRNSRVLFEEALKKVSDFKPGLDQTTAAMELFGKGVDDAMRLQKLNNTVLDLAKQKNADLALTITKENVTASQEYRAAMNDVGDVMTAVQKAVGDAVMPVFTELAQYFASSGPYVVSVFKGALTGLLTVFRSIQMVVKTVSAAVFEMISSVVDQAGNLSDVIGALLSGDFDRATAAATAFKDRYKQAWSNVGTAAVDAYNDAVSAGSDDMVRVWGKGSAATDAAKGGKDRFKGSAGTPDKKDPGRMPQWEAELTEKKAQLAEQSAVEGVFRQLSLADERAFWQEKLQASALTQTEEIGLRRKAAQALLGINKERFDAELEELKTQRAEAEKNFAERIRLAEDSARRVALAYGQESKEAKVALAEVAAERRAYAQQERELQAIAAQRLQASTLAGIEAEREAARLSLDLGLSTQAEVLAQEAQFEQRRYAIQLDALQAKRALIDPTRDPVAKAQADASIETLELQHQQRLAQIRGQALLESQATARQIGGALESSFASVLSRIGTSITSIGALMRGLMQALLQTFVQMLAQMAAKYLVNKLLMKAINKVSAVGEIAAEAGKAGAGGVASMAAAPFPINLGAPAFGAAMSALAMGFLPMASAAGGYDIPANVNPVTQLHAREMVLPAKHADVIRAMADNGANSPAGSGVQVQLNAMPMPGNFFMVHRDQLVKAIQSAQRDFALK
jgi:hypothetical protein